MESRVCFNVGAGNSNLPGFVPLDRRFGDEAFPMTYRGKLVDDCSVDELYCSHVLEHFSFRDTTTVLAEWHRVLKPGGRLRVAVPSLDWWEKTYNSEAASDFPLEQYMFGGHQDENDYHKSFFNEEKLRTVLREAGFSRIRPWVSEIRDCAGSPVSLNLEGYKRRGLKVEGITGILSIPRLLFADQVVCVMEATNKLGIPIRLRQGVYWDQTLTLSIETAIAIDNPKYLLILDYDSLFTPEDVEDLYELMETREDIDALCALQMGRERQQLLMSMKPKEGESRAFISRNDLYADTLPIRTGHFGLTMIRAESLAKLPKPWLCAKPDESGGWGKGRIDADVSFWLGWEAAGLSLHLAPHVVAGHIQAMATWPNSQLRPTHQYLRDYRAVGKPSDVIN